MSRNDRYIIVSHACFVQKRVFHISDAAYFVDVDGFSPPGFADGFLSFFGLGGFVIVFRVAVVDFRMARGTGFPCEL